MAELGVPLFRQRLWGPVLTNSSRGRGRRGAQGWNGAELGGGTGWEGRKKVGGVLTLSALIILSSSVSPVAVPTESTYIVVNEGRIRRPGSLAL